jgi:hypothetical protein
MGQTGLSVLEQDEIHLVGLWHNVLVTLWRGSTTLESMKQLGVHHREADRRFVNGFCALAVVEAVSSLRMDPEVRAEAARLSQNPGQNLKASAQVIQGTGLGAATTRMIASGLMLLRKKTMPSKLFDELPAAARWLMAYVKPAAQEPTPTAADLVSAIGQVWTRK